MRFMCVINSVGVIHGSHDVVWSVDVRSLWASPVSSYGVSDAVMLLIWWGGCKRRRVSCIIAQKVHIQGDLCWSGGFQLCGRTFSSKPGFYSCKQDNAIRVMDGSGKAEQAFMLFNIKRFSSQLFCTNAANTWLEIKSHALSCISIFYFYTYLVAYLTLTF